MSFQSAVNFYQGAGVIGDKYADGPWRAQSYTLESADAAYNVFGRAFTIVAQGFVEAGGTGVFAGILANPKQNTLQGTAAGGSLAPSLTLPNYAQADIVSEGSIFVTLPGAAAIGDLVVYHTTTGVLDTISPGDPLPASHAFAQAVVDYFTVTGEGLAVITLTPTLVIPEPAP